MDDADASTLAVADRMFTCGLVSDNYSYPLTTISLPHLQDVFSADKRASKSVFTEDPQCRLSRIDR